MDRRRKLFLQLRSAGAAEQRPVDPVLGGAVPFFQAVQGQQAVQAGVPLVLGKSLIEVFIRLAVVQLKENFGEGDAVVRVVIIKLQVL